MATKVFSRVANDGRYGTILADEVVEVTGYPFVGVLLGTVAGATATVQASNDKVVWVTFGSVTAVAGSGFVAGVYPCRYIRVTTTGTVGHISITACRSGS